MRDRQKKKPIGQMARTYVLPSILTVFRPSRRDVVLASICVMIVAKTRCHVVKKMGNRNPAVSRTHLLNRITEPLKKIQIPTKKAGCSSILGAAEPELGEDGGCIDTGGATVGPDSSSFPIVISELGRTCYKTVICD